jgi:YVTN family beta-propeller protein
VINAKAQVVATIDVGISPLGVGVNLDGSKVYVANFDSNTVSVIDTATNTVTDTILSVSQPVSVAVNPQGTKIYVSNVNGTVSVIDTVTNTVIATISVGAFPSGVAVTPDGSKVYVANFGSNSVSVINTATDKVIATIPVGSEPLAFGVFIQPAPIFAGTPGKANCYGKSVSALVRQYHGLHAAAAALGFSRIRALEKAILEFCEG